MKQDRDILTGLPTKKLTTEQEAQYFASKDYETLILHNLREAVLYAGRCAHGRIEPGELLSLCYTALRKAAPRFRPGQIRFLAYSKQDLRGEIARFWKSQNTVHRAYLHETEPPPSKPCRFAPGLSTSDDDDEKIIESEYVEPEFEAINLRERWAMVLPLIKSRLNEREQTVLHLFYDAGLTFEQISQMMVPSVCREAIRMTHERALHKLKKALLCKESLLGTV